MAEQIPYKDKQKAALFQKGLLSIVSCCKKLMRPERYTSDSLSKIDGILAFIENSRQIIYSLGDGRSVDKAALEDVQFSLFKEVLKAAGTAANGKQVTGAFSGLLPLVGTVKLQTSENMPSYSVFRHGR